MRGKIFLYGVFGFDISDADFVRQLEQLRAGGYGEVDIFLNSPGGDVPAGIAMFNALDRSSLKCTLYVDGIAASMGAALLCSPRLDVKAYKYSKIMLHRVNGYISGNPDEIESELKLVREFEDNLIDMFSEKTGLAVDEVRSRFFDGANHWLNAEEALELGIVSEILDSDKALDQPKSLSNPNDVYNYFRTQISNRNTDIDMKNKLQFTALLKLDNEASEEAIYKAAENAVKAQAQLKTENEALKAERDQHKAKVDAMNQARVETLINSAITAKKITADEKAVYVQLAETNFELAEKTLEKLPGHKSIMNQIDGKDGVNSIYAQRKDWSFQEWQKKDGRGLQNMKTDNVELYKSLYKAQFGKEPII